MQDDTDKGVIRISVGVYPEQARALQEQAELMGSGMSAALRFIINDWSRIRQASDLSKKDDFIVTEATS